MFLTRQTTKAYDCFWNSLIFSFLLKRDVWIISFKRRGGAVGRARCGWKPMLEGMLLAGLHWWNHFFFIRSPWNWTYPKISLKHVFRPKGFCVLFVFVGLQSSAARMFPWHGVTHPRYNRARDCRGGHLFSTQIRSGFTKRQSCYICLALREEYSDVPD